MFKRLKQMLGFTHNTAKEAANMDVLNVDLSRASQANERASNNLIALVKQDKAGDEINRVFEKLLGQLK